MDEPTKRAWCTPELIVLVRSGPEEAVLVACKADVGGYGSALDGWHLCAYPQDNDICTATCNSTVKS